MWHDFNRFVVCRVSKRDEALLMSGSGAEKHEPPIWPKNNLLNCIGFKINEYSSILARAGWLGNSNGRRLYRRPEC